MKRRLITVMLFAILAALASSTILYKIVSASSSRGAKTTTVPVFVATRNLSAGTLITESDVRVVEWPETTGAQWIRKRADIVGRALLTPIGKDEPFAESRLMAKGSDSTLASRIPSGMRAVAVHVDESTGLSRSMVAGMHVDVISTANSAGINPGTRTILQNVEVFSTGQEIERDAKEKAAAVQSVNLLVTPQQAEILSQAVAQTKIELILRNPMDTGSFLPSVASSLSHLSDGLIGTKRLRSHAGLQAEQSPPKGALATASASVAVLTRPVGPTVEVIHGNKRVITTVGTAPEQEKLQ